ncbi:MAG: LD-carboxypeptidase [Proteobacteria bacterium]|nr:LD-carboxypeptidase [Pseudomonadota bacterium]
MLKNLIVPQKLNAGDKIAIVASSWGGPAIFPHKVQKGIDQLEKHFDVKCVVMPFAQKSADVIYNNPQKRAEELMQCFADPEIKGIISAIGGDDSIRMLPYIDYKVIRKNPKVFMGMSDSTITNFICLKARVRSYYGPAMMAGFAENGGLLPFMRESVRKTLFEKDVIGEIGKNTDGIIIKQHPWEDESLTNTPREILPVPERKLILGSKNAKGRLIGGCLDVLEFMKGTEIWPDLKHWKDAILFIEASEDEPTPEFVIWWLRNYAALGILNKLSGILVGRPGYVKEDYERFYQEQEDAILKVVRDECKLDIPILTRLDFGHTDPQIVLPLGAMAEIDVDKKTFSILESGVK